MECDDALSSNFIPWFLRPTFDHERGLEMVVEEHFSILVLGMNHKRGPRSILGEDMRLYVGKKRYVFLLYLEYGVNRRARGDACWRTRYCETCAFN